jgi:hypothetical protein
MAKRQNSVALARVIPLIGKTFGHLTVLRVFSNGEKIICECRCDCGNLREADAYNLRRGQSTSCGCVKNLRISQSLMRHGHASHGKPTTEYAIWSAMIQRCTNPNNNRYARYGQRGIKVCDRWKNSFENFLSDVGPRPSARHSIDRINNDGNYEPGNVRWATAVEQARHRTSSLIVEYLGESKSLMEWCDTLGLRKKYWSIVRRIRAGWEPTDAFNRSFDVKRKGGES